MRRRAGLTLVELVVSVCLLLMVLATVLVSLGYVLKQVDVLAERYTMYTQMSYALDDLRARSHSAARIDSDSFFTSKGGSLPQFGFLGERDIFNVTPDDLSDNVGYRYFVDPLKGDFVREAEGRREVLVEGKYRPAVRFEYYSGDEPNMLVVTLNASSTKHPAGGLSRTIAKMGTIRFWFVNIVQ